MEFIRFGEVTLTTLILLFDHFNQIYDLIYNKRNKRKNAKKKTNKQMDIMNRLVSTYTQLDTSAQFKNIIA